MKVDFQIKQLAQALKYVVEQMDQPLDPRRVNERAVERDCIINELMDILREPRDGD